MNKIFEKGGKLHWLHSTVDAFETFLHVPGTVALKGAHVRDAVDIKRIMIIAVIAAAVAACGCSAEQIACIRRVKSDAWNVNARAEAISVRKECF